MSEALHGQDQVHTPQSKAPARSSACTPRSSKTSETNSRNGPRPARSAAVSAERTTSDAPGASPASDCIQPQEASSIRGDSSPQAAAAGQHEFDADDDVCRMSSVRDTPASSVATVRPARSAHPERSQSSASKTQRAKFAGPPAAEIPRGELQPSKVTGFLQDHAAQHRAVLQPPGNGSSLKNDGAEAKTRTVLDHGGPHGSAPWQNRGRNGGKEKIPAAGSSTSPPLPKPRYALLALGHAPANRGLQWSCTLLQISSDMHQGKLQKRAGAHRQARSGSAALFLPF